MACKRKRMGSAGMRCFCNGKLAKSARCGIKKKRARKVRRRR